MKKLERLKGRLATALIVTMLATVMAPASFAAGRSARAEGAEIKFEDEGTVTLQSGQTKTLKVVLAEEGGSGNESASPSSATPDDASSSGDQEFLLESVETSNPDLIKIVSYPMASESELSVSAEIEIKAADQPDFSQGRSAVITATTTAGKVATCTVKVLGAQVETSISKSSIEYGGSAVIKAKALYTTGIENAAVSIEVDSVDYGLTLVDPAEEVSFYALQEDESETENQVTIYSDPSSGVSGTFTIPVTVTLTGDNIEPKEYEDEVTLTVADPELKLVAEPSELKLGRDEKAVISIDPDCSAAEIAFAQYNWQVVSGEDVIELVPDNAEAEAVLIGAGEAKVALKAVVEPKEGPSGREGQTVELEAEITLVVEEMEKVIPSLSGNADNAEIAAPEVDDEALQEQIDEIMEAARDLFANMAELADRVELPGADTPVEDYLETEGDLSLAEDEVLKVYPEQTLESVKISVNEDGTPSAFIEEMQFDIDLKFHKENVGGGKVPGSDGTAQLKNGHTMKFPIPLPDKGIDRSMKYAHVDHEHKGVVNEFCRIIWDDPDISRPYILVEVNHFSKFTLTFVEEIPNTESPVVTPGSSSGGRRGSGGSGHSYTPAGQWMQDGGRWYYRNSNGSRMTSCWSELTWNGVPQWYRFDENGYMLTGWFTDFDGNRYFMHNVADGNQGHMYTGWHFIQGSWYYFRDYTGGPKGSLVVNGVTPDGYTTDANGACAAYPGNAAR